MNQKRPALEIIGVGRIEVSAAEEREALKLGSGPIYTQSLSRLRSTTEDQAASSLTVLLLPSRLLTLVAAVTPRLSVGQTSI
jgi:hypothetical protein